MSDSWTQRWNDRYSDKAFAYGEEPNLYLKEQLQKLKAGSILFAAEDEGRNAIFTARPDWKVYAFDTVLKGKRKLDYWLKKITLQLIISRSWIHYILTKSGLMYLL
jgi:hypothetical protein